MRINMSMQDSEEVPQMQPTLCKDDMSNVKTNPNITLVSPKENAKDDFLPDIEVGEHDYKSDESTHQFFLGGGGGEKWNKFIPFLRGH